MKKKEEPKKAGFSGFQLKKSINNTQGRPSKPFGFSKDDDEDLKEEKIDTFDSNEGGAFSKKEGPKVKEGPLVIQNQGNSNWRAKAQQRFKPDAEKSLKEVESKKLEYGINYLKKGDDEKEKKEALKESQGKPILSHDQDTLSFKEDVESRPDMATLEDYEKIPVESFGAAMLRGMGWKEDKEDPEEKSKKKPVIPVAQRTMYLGLGAKDDNKDRGLKPINKSYIPIKKVNRETGDVIQEESRSNLRNRERSPSRSNGSNSYRTRN